MKRTPMVVAVTGGTSGIGLAVAELFMARGHPVAVCSRSPRANALRSAMVHVPLDVRRRDAVAQFAKDVRQRFGTLDVLVNCAGVSRWRAITDVDEVFAEELIGTNLLGTLWGCAAAAAVMKRGGCIVNISSLAGKRGSANNSVYCATKFAVNGLTQALAKELGPRGIRVNAVCPVYVETEHVLLSLADPASPAAGRNVRTYLSSFASTQTALGRLPTAREVAEVVYFLASPAASAITGQCVNVDCGVLPQ
ncbi:MAG: SDR family oxidoreductase [Candidatus Omnitrophica bacterium]|nr:SDR family oxidoreductase [Candidatus Omnitrophota bacterium]